MDSAFAWAVAAGLAVGTAMTGWVAWRGDRAGPATDGPATDPGRLLDDGTDDHLARIARRSLDSLRVGVLVLDAIDRPVLTNPAARLLGLVRAGTDVGSPVAHPIVRTLAGEVRRTGVRREVERDIPRGGTADGEAVGVQLRAVALGSGYVAVEGADVTDAHRVARARRDFVANVSHELKTPIGALQLLSEALLDVTDGDDGHDPAAARRFADRIYGESTRLGRLVAELIELSRLQGADPLPEPEPVSVDWLVAEVVDRTRTAATAKQIAVHVAGASGLTVYGSDGQLATAVANLVENAIAYSAEGSEVTVVARHNRDAVEIAVVDAGMGIAPDDLVRVFERFYRTDQARSRATGGTGLGLAIVKHIATNHGGRVYVTSKLGVGSTFTLRLPDRPPDAALALLHSVDMAESVDIAAKALPHR